MRFIELARAAPVRYALIFARFATIVMGILLGVIYWSMVTLLERHLEENINQQMEVLRHDLEQDGRDSMIGLVRQHVEKQPGSRVHFLVRDGKGNVLAGDLPSVPVETGWQDILVVPNGNERSNERHMVRGHGEWFDENTHVLVTNDMSDLAQSRTLIIRSFGIALGVTVLLALGGGLIIGRLLLCD